MLFAAVLMVAATSCKKDYTCECTVNAAGITTSSSTTINATKSDAEDACNAGDATSTVLGTTYSTSCEIK